MRLRQQCEKIVLVDFCPADFFPVARQLEILNAHAPYAAAGRRRRAL
jgi:hypothetical protein